MSIQCAGVSGDRRHRRRRETIDEIVDHAVAVMTEYGVAGLSLGEVARRMGMRTPSLYGYFDSKHAVYDAVFERGWTAVADTFADLNAQVETAPDLPAYLLEMATRIVRWDIEHPVHAQLMGWRPVPGYEPSAAAYAPAVAVFEDGRRIFTRLQARGLFRSDVDVDALLRMFTVVTSGVMTQQLANAPDEPFETGTFTSTLPEVVRMYLAHYGADHRSTTRRNR
jgi:AcrR family transcriptional regulator